MKVKSRVNHVVTDSNFMSNECVRYCTSIYTSLLYFTHYSRFTSLKQEITYTLVYDIYTAFLTVYTQNLH